MLTKSFISPRILKNHPIIVLKGELEGLLPCWLCDSVVIAALVRHAGFESRSCRFFLLSSLAEQVEFQRNLLLLPCSSVQ